MGRERGQAVVEFAVIGLILMMLTVGLVDAGRAFYQYNAVSAAARYGARWGGVVGGTCAAPHGVSNNDWCTQLSQGVTTDFFNTPGNDPLQGNSSCPNPQTIPNPPPQNGPYYTVSPTYTANTSTTIVGAIAHHFDTSSSSSNLILGALTPGFDLSKLLVCIQFPSIDYQSGSKHWTVGYGDTVTVYVYYPFTLAGNLFGNIQLNLIGSSQYPVEP